MQELGKQKYRISIGSVDSFLQKVLLLLAGIKRRLLGIFLMID